MAEGADVINLGRGIQTNQPMTILLEGFVPQRKILLAISIPQFRGNRPFKEAALGFTRNIMGSIWMRSVRFVSWRC